MRRSNLAALAVSALASTVAGAASAQPIEGLYIGASGGANFLDTERLRGLTTSTGVVLTKPGQPVTFDTGWVAVGSVGYALGNGVRLEVEGNGRRNNRTFNASTRPWAGLNPTGSEAKTGAMANVFFDTDIGSRYVFPYFGAGAGWQSVNVKQTGTITTNASQSSFAYQAMFGLGFPIPGVVGLSMTTEFRYFTLNAKRRFAGTTTQLGGSTPMTAQYSENNNYSLMMGVRYAFNVTPPPAPQPPAPVPVAAVAPSPARSYLVFFDWDSSALNDRARQIVAEAAQASKRVAETRIELAGHADQTGSAAYNLALSRKRGAVVAGELVRLGVAASSISVTAFGDSKPLVPTAPGTREPQNRRVEIVLK